LDGVRAYDRSGAHHHAEELCAVVRRTTGNARSRPGFLFSRRRQLDFLRRQAADDGQSRSRRRSRAPDQARSVGARLTPRRRLIEDWLDSVAARRGFERASAEDVLAREIERRLFERLEYIKVTPE